MNWNFTGYKTLVTSMLSIIIAMFIFGFFSCFGGPCIDEQLKKALISLVISFIIIFSLYSLFQKKQ